MCSSDLAVVIDDPGRRRELLSAASRVIDDPGRRREQFALLRAPTPRTARTREEEVREYRQKMRSSWRQTRKTLVRITQGAGGLVQSVELVQASSDAASDNELLRELRQGTIQLPTPPATGMGIKTPLRAVWSFEIIISISPPVPTIAGSFDEVTGKVDIRLPLDRRIYKYVELVSVD